MSQLHKEIDTLRQKVYYIDTSVNTFFNKTLINIQKSLNDLNIRIIELEKKMNEDSNTNNSNDVNTNNSNYVKTNNSNDVKTKKVDKKSQNNNSNLPNQIRTISLQ